MALDGPCHNQKSIRLFNSSLSFLSFCFYFFYQVKTLKHFMHKSIFIAEGITILPISFFTRLERKLYDENRSKAKKRIENDIHHLWKLSAVGCN